MYKYSLHKKSTKNECPNCHKKTLVLYVDIETDEHVSPIVGRCDREINCGYHYSPKSYFMDTNQEIKNFVSNDFLQIKNQFASYHHQKELENIVIILLRFQIICLILLKNIIFPII